MLKLSSHGLENSPRTLRGNGRAALIALSSSSDKARIMVTSPYRRNADRLRPGLLPRYSAFPSVRFRPLRFLRDGGSAFGGFADLLSRGGFEADDKARAVPNLYVLAIDE